MGRTEQKMAFQLGSSSKFALCAVGIFVCYFYYGILQEKITRGKYVYDGKEERFTQITALVFFQCVVNYFYAFVMSFIFLTPEKDTTKSSYYAICSLTYLLAMVTSNKVPILYLNSTIMQMHGEIF